MEKEEKTCLYTDNILKVMKGRRLKNDYTTYFSQSGIAYQDNPKLYHRCTWYLKFCIMCGSYIKTHMINKLTCSDNCRHKLHRLRKKGINGLINKGNVEQPSREDLRKFGFEKK
jgi:hypothetical protein